MDWDRRRFEDRRGGESYRPSDRSGRSPSRGYDARPWRSPPRNRSRLRGDTWVPSSRAYPRPRSRSPPMYRRRSRSPPPRGYGSGSFVRRRSPPRRPSPRREDRDRIRSPLGSWRSRSPQSEGRSRDISRGRGSPRPAREPHLDATKSQPNMRSGPGTPAYSSPGAKSLSRPPSPLHYAGPARGPPPMRNRSRSPAQQSPSRHYSDRLGPRSHRDREGAFNADAVNCQNGSGSLDRVEKENTKADQSRASRDTPTQPRNSRTSQSPPTGPANDSNPTANTHQASSTLSLLSAPTRPRRGPGSRDGPWGGGPIVRRGPPTTTPPNAPSGPRASFIPNSASAGFSGPGHYRHSTPRQNNPPPLTTSALPKATNHLANLSTVLPGGRMLPSALDAATEKRFSQLEADQEKLLEQLADAQRLKRAGLRDWDRLDRETSICALKSELAEGHLQRIADESLAGGIPF